MNKQTPVIPPSGYIAKQAWAKELMQRGERQQQCRRQTMNTAVTIFGWLCLVFICAAVAGFAVSLAADLVRRSMERFEFAVAEKTRTDIGRSLVSSAHWFSESKDAQYVICTLASRLRDQYAIDVDQWRAEWRRLRSQKEGDHNGAR